MKVLYICTSADLYGDNIAILNIIPHLKKMGVIPIFYTSRRGRFSEKLEELSYKCLVGYDVLAPGRWPTISIKAILGLIRRILFVQHSEYRRLLHDISVLNIDLIHSNLSTTTLGYKLAKDLGLPHVWHIREYIDLDHGGRHFPTKKALKNKIEDNVNKVIFITDSIFKYYGSPSNGFVIYDGVITDEKKPIIFNEDKGYYLYVGRLIETKGILQLLNAYLLYTEKSTTIIPLKIAGSGSYAMEKKLKKICSLHPNGNLVDFLGYRNDISDLMANARALIVPSRFEAFGFISVEAMTYGCPVIGHDVAGTKCQFDNGVIFTKHEIGYRYNNGEELVSCLCELSRKNRKDILSIIRDAQDTVFHYYTAKQSAEDVMKIYKLIISHNQ